MKNNDEINTAIEIASSPTEARNDDKNSTTEIPNAEANQEPLKSNLFSKIYTATAFGTEGKIIEVEATFTRGLPNFLITGLANSSIQESKQRVASALQNNDFALPPYKINVNLAPSDLPKTGSHFDLPIAVVVALQSQNFISDSTWFAFGELGLNGEVKYAQNIYPLLLDVSLEAPGASVILPDSARELLSPIPNLKKHFVSNIKEAVECVKNPAAFFQENTSDFANFKHIEIGGEKYYFSDTYELDFLDVLGQTRAKRAALIAAAGFHNFILEGSPGCGKSMIAKRLRYILPPSTLREMIESVKLQSLSRSDSAYSPLRPFRAPHQSASKSSVLGSATQFEPRPGEIALAHNGVLFFDELPHFQKAILEALREPLENNTLCVSRVASKLEYATSFLFVGAMNPCPCGNSLSPSKECRCAEADIRRYKSCLSEPFLDRIDLFCQMDELNENAAVDEKYSSAEMQKAVFKAFEAQIKRGQSALNGKLNEKEIAKFCVLDSEARGLLEQATSRFNLSLRAANKLLKTARTIADLESSFTIHKSHMLEAISYRKLD